MSTTIEERKEEALKRLEYLAKNGMKFKAPIEAFKHNEIGIFENQGSIFKAIYYNLKQNRSQKEYQEMYEKVIEFESKYNATVYLIQITHTEFGKAISMFYVSNHKEEWNYDWEDFKENLQCVNTYCGGMHDIGSIEFAYDRTCGGIYRVA